LVYTQVVYTLKVQGMSPKFPILKRWSETDSSGRVCLIFISIELTCNKDFYPPSGIKSVFRVLRQKTAGVDTYEAVLLIDNHEPFGFHEHPKLPENHDIRRFLKVDNWQDAWNIFDVKLKELLDET
jgi:hypothetical protein